MYTLLILSPERSWPIYGVCVCIFVNPLLSFLPPLQSRGRTDNKECNDWVQIAPLLLGSIICVLAPVVSCMQVYRATGKAHGPSRERIIDSVVSMAQGIAFFVLFWTFPLYKQRCKNMSLVCHFSFSVTYFTDLQTVDLVRDVTFDLEILSIHLRISVLARYS